MYKLQFSLGFKSKYYKKTIVFNRNYYFDYFCYIITYRIAKAGLFFILKCIVGFICELVL